MLFCWLKCAVSLSERRPALSRWNVKSPCQVTVTTRSLITGSTEHCELTQFINLGQQSQRRRNLHAGSPRWHPVSCSWHHLVGFSPERSHQQLFHRSAPDPHSSARRMQESSLVKRQLSSAMSVLVDKRVNFLSNVLFECNSLQN